MQFFRHLVCRSLIASLLCLPFGANAGMVNTEDAVAHTQAPGARGAVRAFVAREGVARELQAMGVSTEAAQARVAALTEEEVTRLAGQIDTLPAAGAMAHAVVIALVLLVIAGIAYFIWSSGNTAK